MYRKPFCYMAFVWPALVRWSLSRSSGCGSSKHVQSIGHASWQARRPVRILSGGPCTSRSSYGQHRAFHPCAVSPVLPRFQSKVRGHGMSEHLWWGRSWKCGSNSNRRHCFLFYALSPDMHRIRRCLRFLWKEVVWINCGIPSFQFELTTCRCGNVLVVYC